MQDQSSQTPTVLSLACVEHLKTLALAATDSRRPKLPTRSEILRIGTERQVRLALAAVRRQMAPATPEEVSRHFLALAVIYPLQLSEEQTSLKFHIFSDDLAALPERVLAKACEQYRRAIAPPNRFFPTPGELLGLADPDLRETRKLLRGLDAIERALDAAPAAVEPEATIDAARMSEILAALGDRKRSMR
jgi:hypothetical protein